MNEAQFREQLSLVTRKAREQGGCISRDELAEAFPDMVQSETQMGFLLDYLKEQKISVGTKAEVDEYLSIADRDYLKEYEKELAEMTELPKEQMAEVLLSVIAGEDDAIQVALEQFLPKVISLAKLYTGQGVLLEDLIGEGNLALAEGMMQLGCIDTEADVCEEAEGFLGKLMMDAMEALINEELTQKDKDEKVVTKVNRVADAAREISEDLRRKISAEELCANTELTLEDVEEALRMSGNKIEDLEDLA